MERYGALLKSTFMRAWRVLRIIGALSSTALHERGVCAQIAVLENVFQEMRESKYGMCVRFSSCHSSRISEV